MLDTILGALSGGLGQLWSIAGLTLGALAALVAVFFRVRNDGKNEERLRNAVEEQIQDEQLDTRLDAGWKAGDGVAQHGDSDGLRVDDGHKRPSRTKPQ